MIRHGIQPRLMALVIGCVAVIFLISSCGGGSTYLAGGGIGGTGRYTGVITGFGSVIVNNIHFDTSGATIIVDNRTATVDDLAMGMKVEIEAADKAASSIVFEPEVKGRVEDLDPEEKVLIVLHQIILVHNNTKFKGFNNLGDLRVGEDFVKVSGFFDADGKIRSTYIELTTPLLEVALKGTVANLDPLLKTLTLGGLPVNYSNVSYPPVLGNSDFVKVVGMLSQGTLFALEIGIEDPVFFGKPGQRMEVEGFITEVTSQNNFTVNGQRVSTNPQTVFENGSPADIALNARVEVEGMVNEGFILIAEKVEFESDSESETGDGDEDREGPESR